MHISENILLVIFKFLISRNIKAFKTFSLLVILVCTFIPITAQEVEQIKKDTKEAATFLSEGSQAMQEDQFIAGEVMYRKAIAIKEKETTGNYNLGNAYYTSSKNEEALVRFTKAAKNATTKPERHKAFHNLGNSLMNQKEYAGAVDAYKNALRNNPTDDESRYNLALAKDMLEKNPPEDGGGDDDKEQENKDDQNKKDDQESEDEKEKDEKKDGEDGDEKDEKDKGDQEDKDKEGDKEEDKGKPDEPKDPKDEQGEGEQPKQEQPVPGQLSPQEVKNLLESMNNEEKKVQDKINAKKQKGAKVKSDKDW